MGRYAIEERFLRNLPARCLGITLVPDIPFGNGQIIYRDDVDAQTLEVMGCAAQAVPFWLSAAGASRRRLCLADSRRWRPYLAS